MGFPTITGGGRASTTTVYGGAELTKLQNLFAGINIAASDSTNKPVISTEVTFASAMLKFLDANATNTIKIITPDISVDVSAQFPITMTTVLADNTFLMTGLNQIVTNKTIDAGVNSITNIADTNVKAGAAISWSKISKTGSKLNDVANMPVANPGDGQSIVYNAASNAWVYYTTITSSDINLPNKTSSLPVASTGSVPMYRNDLDANNQRVYFSKLEAGTPVLVRVV
jgi:hypothetical protein